MACHIERGSTGSVVRIDLSASVELTQEFFLVFSLGEGAESIAIARVIRASLFGGAEICTLIRAVGTFLGPVVLSVAHARALLINPNSRDSSGTQRQWRVAQYAMQFCSSPPQAGAQAFVCLVWDPVGLEPTL